MCAWLWKFMLTKCYHIDNFLVNSEDSARLWYGIIFMPILIIHDIGTLTTPSVTQYCLAWIVCVRLTWVRNSHLLCAMLEKDEKLCFRFLQILSDNRIVRFQAWSLNQKLKSSVHFSDSACSLHFFPRFYLFQPVYSWCPLTSISLSNCFSVYTISTSIV